MHAPPVEVSNILEETQRDETLPQQQSQFPTISGIHRFFVSGLFRHGLIIRLFAAPSQLSQEERMRSMRRGARVAPCLAHTTIRASHHGFLRGTLERRFKVKAYHGGGSPGRLCFVIVELLYISRRSLLSLIAGVDTRSNCITISNRTCTIVYS